MNEGNLNNENNSVQPEVNVQPTEPVVPVQPVQPVVPTQPVQQSVQPVAPAQPMQQPPLQSVVAEQLKKKSMLPVVLIILLLLVIAGCLVYYFFLKDKISLPGSNNNTTTQSSKLLDIKSIDDYVNIAKPHIDGEYARSFAVLLDNSFKDLNYELNDRCKNDGDKVSFEKNGIKIEYTCKLDEECEDEDICSPSDPEWVASITVNDKYKTTEYTYTTCNSWAHFTNGKYFVTDNHGCAVGMERLGIMSDENKEILNTHYEVTYVKEYNSETYDMEEEPTPILIKDNILYYVAADEIDGVEGESTCRVKYVDFNQDKVEVKDMNVTAKCYYFAED